jgi:hypothetical protein
LPRRVDAHEIAALYAFERMRDQPSVIGIFANTAPCTMTGLVTPNTSAFGAKPLWRISKKAHPAAIAAFGRREKEDLVADIQAPRACVRVW